MQDNSGAHEALQKLREIREIGGMLGFETPLTKEQVLQALAKMSTDYRPTYQVSVDSKTVDAALETVPKEYIQAYEEFNNTCCAAHRFDFALKLGIELGRVLHAVRAEALLDKFEGMLKEKTTPTPPTEPPTTNQQANALRDKIKDHIYRNTHGIPPSFATAYGMSADSLLNHLGMGKPKPNLMEEFLKDFPNVAPKPITMNELMTNLEDLPEGVFTVTDLPPMTTEEAQEFADRFKAQITQRIGRGARTTEEKEPGGFTLKFER